MGRIVHIAFDMTKTCFTLNSVNSVNLVHVNYPVNSVNLVHVNHPVNSVNPVCVNYPVLIRAWNEKPDIG